MHALIAWLDEHDRNRWKATAVLIVVALLVLVGAYHIGLYGVLKIISVLKG